MNLKKYIPYYQPYFWQWEEEGSVISIPNSNTITYRKYIIDLLEKLQPQGFPPFGSLLLVLIATNPNGEVTLNTISSIISQLENGNTPTLVSDAISFLKLVSTIPEKYKTGNKRILLLQALFYNCHNLVGHQKAKSILKELQYQDITHIESSFQITPYSFGSYSRDFQTLAVLKNRFPTVDALIERMHLLPEISDDAIELNELPSDVKKPETFIDELIEHDKTFYVGSLIKRIWSGLNIPFHSIVPSAQPLGGVSDLTNKGDFDKLLISEFANDDIVLLSRLANNEALYLHREVPPTNQHQHRIMLIDVSLKTWGTPKVLSFATAIAITQHPKTDITHDVFLVGKKHKLIELNSVDHVIESLQYVDAGIHAAQGIRSFMNENKLSTNQEIILITEPSTLKQTEMLKVMTDFHHQIKYWIYTEDNGEINVYKKHQSSKKHIQHLKLPLKELWTKKATTHFIIPSQASTSFPILFRYNINTKKILRTHDGELFSISNVNSLFRFHDKYQENYAKGWEFVCSNIPRFDLGIEIGKHSSQEYFIILFDRQQQQINLFNIFKQTKTSIDFLDWQIASSSHLIFHEDHFIYFNYNDSYHINPITSTIEKKSGTFQELFKIREGILSTHSKTSAFTQNILKNIQQVFINTNNELVINKHILRIKDRQYIKLEVTTSTSKKIKAEKVSPTEFHFPNGHILEINLNGMIILKSRNKSTPNVYIPSVIDLSLGVATDEYFTGNIYFQKDPLFDIFLKHPGAQKINIIKKLKDLYPDIELQKLKNFVDNSPSLIEKFASRKRATHITTLLVSEGAQIDIKAIELSSSDNMEQKAIHPNSFFEQFIQSFITSIVDHGN